MPDGPPRRLPPGAPKPLSQNAFIDEANKIGQGIAHGLGIINHQVDPDLFVDCVIDLRDSIRDNEELLRHAFTIWVDHSPPAWEPTASGVLEGVVKIGQRVVCAAAVAARKDWKSQDLKHAITQNFAASSAFVRPILDRFNAESVKAELICSAKRLVSTPNLIAPSQLRYSDLGWLICWIEMAGLLPEGYAYLLSDKEREAAILMTAEKQTDRRRNLSPSPGDQQTDGKAGKPAKKSAKGRGGRNPKVPPWYSLLKEVLNRVHWQGWRQQYHRRRIKYEKLVAELNENWEGDRVTPRSLQNFFKLKLGQQLLEQKPGHKQNPKPI